MKRWNGLGILECLLTLTPRQQDTSNPKKRTWGAYRFLSYFYTPLPTEQRNHSIQAQLVNYKFPGLPCKSVSDPQTVETLRSFTPP